MLLYLNRFELGLFLWCTAFGWFGMSGFLGGVITKCVHSVVRDDVPAGSAARRELREVLREARRRVRS